MKKEQIAVLVRTAVLFLALLNQLLMVFGYSILPISEQELSELLTLGAVILLRGLLSLLIHVEMREDG